MFIHRGESRGGVPAEDRRVRLRDGRRVHHRRDTAGGAAHTEDTVLEHNADHRQQLAEHLHAAGERGARGEEAAARREGPGRERAAGLHLRVPAVLLAGVRGVRPADRPGGAARGRQPLRLQHGGRGGHGARVQQGARPQGVRWELSHWLLPLFQDIDAGKQKRTNLVYLFQQCH